MQTKLRLTILESLARGPEHGYRIAQRVKRLRPGLLDGNEAVLYPLLHDLELEGLAISHVQTHNGRERRYYRLTEHGKKVLVEVRQEEPQLIRSLSPLTEDA